jgi:hypothetical protein
LIGFLAYTSIVATMTLSYLGMPWWTALFGAAVLASISIAEQQKLRPRFAAVGATDVLLMGALASLANALLAAGGAFAMGRLIGWAAAF